ncbi:hypothetical protein C6N75_06015 [Streptomyces solincola]|uniref:Uncharacterized protein n=1 Tax=Streptomyces solincola TaxID=2100817 RepID=A0A2S9Q0E9_9ACTN|nr:hypothetical protein [Streptomyces solincola]PRH80087.1 hypothetical protein C6N75_06015 [Streptomyces solincola]
MSPDRPTLPPVRLPSEAELARDALAAPLLVRAVRLARWAGPETRVDQDGELDEGQLAAAAVALGLIPDEDGQAYAGEAWRVALDTGLVLADVSDEEPPAGAADEPQAGTVTAGEQLPLVTGGAPGDVLALWRDALETALADAAAPLFDDLAEVTGEDGEIDLDALDWDPEQEADFLDAVLGNLYLLTVSGGGPADSAVPLPALAASMLVPDDMREPTDDVLEQVSEAMMRLDDQFRVLEPIGLVEYQPVDEALMAEEPDDAAEAAGAADAATEEDVQRYGMVRLTPLGLYGVRTRLVEAGLTAPVIGELADKDADALLGGVADYPEAAALAETAAWLVGRDPAGAARDLLAAARGVDARAPLRRLHCQQALTLVGADAEPAVREVLDDPRLGGLARVWLAERGAPDVPPPPEAMIFWLAVDTIAAQLDAAGGEDLDELRDLVEGLTGQHGGFFDAAWRVDHPATPEVLEAMGRLHRDKTMAKEARKAAFKARSKSGA